MIVLDTNVISEVMKPQPASAVLAWLDEQIAETLYLSSVTVAELLYGIGVLPDGRRKQKLATTLDGILALFDGRIFPSTPRPRVTMPAFQWRWIGEKN